jgi:hypothetical protein
MYSNANPLLRTKFASPDRLPYYNLYRERAALEAAAPVCIDGSTNAAHAPSEVERAKSVVEERLQSTDGLIVGRPDFINASAREVVDYKSGAAPDTGPNTVSDAEARQLRLYVLLALDNGIALSRAVIVRADGRRAAIDVPREDAVTEGARARQLLGEYNTHAGESFSSAAQPSPESCRFCPCIPFCDAFWRNASPSWAARCGINLEGRVISVEASTVQGMNLLTLRVDAQRGTVVPGDMHIEQIPEAWITADGAEQPREGDTVRVVYGRVVGETHPLVLRVDRSATSVWTTSQDQF